MNGRLEPSAAFARFGAGQLAMFLIGLLAVYVPVPPALVPIVDVLLAALFLAIPIWSIGQAARGRWSPPSAFGLVALGVAVQAIGILLFLRTGNRAFPALGGIGLQIWCVGLGALLAVLIREKNILIPVAVFLALFDIFLVLSPQGFTQRIMQAAPKVLSTVGHAIPMANTPERVAAHATVAGYIGPADLVFLGAFLFALARFGVPLGRTLFALTITLGLYLAFVLAMRISLPALLPIGAVTLWVNRREFRLSKDEWASTAVVTGLGLALLAWSWLRRPAVEPPPTPPSASRGQRRSSNHAAPAPRLKTP